MAFWDDDGNEVDPYDPEFQQQQQQDNRNPLRAQLKRLEKKLADLTPELEKGNAAVRQLEFVKAGIDTSNPMATYFMAGYQGEMTADAIKAEAAKLNLIGPAQAPAPEGATDAEKQSHQRMQQAVQEGTVPAERDFDAEMRATSTLPRKEGIAALERLVTEKAAQDTSRPPGVPAIVRD